MKDIYEVYALTDKEGRIININSSAFLHEWAEDVGWVKIDEGYGDKYHHAQGNYLPKAIRDERGIYQFKLVNGQVVERTQAEMDADWEEPKEEPSDRDRIEALEKANAILEQDNKDLKEALDMLLTGVTE